MKIGRGTTLFVVLLACGLSAATAMAGSQMAHVKKAINGNTFLADVNGAETKIRLVGVATPDPNDKTPILKKLGEQASEYLGEFLKNDWVYMEYPNGQAWGYGGYSSSQVVRTWILSFR
jgi:endonuclease YncB( thermonuclease family)